MTDTLYIIDTMSLVFQVFHAIPTMTGPKGQPTNAVFGFTRDLRAIVREKRPTHLVCAMDSSGPGVRNDLYADYKANRTEMPDDLQPQMPLICDVVEGFRVPMLEHAGWEADDIIATLTRRAVERGMQVVVVTSDKDIRQLLGPQVRLYNVRKDSFLDEAGLKGEWCIRPDQVIDFQALVGDSVDNIPGVPLVGPKKAAALLDRFGTLDEVLAHADEAPGKKLRENLKEFAEQARMSRELVRLNTELPLEIDWETARVHEPDRERLFALFTELGFRRLSEEMLRVKGRASRVEGQNPDVEFSGSGPSTLDSRPPGGTGSLTLDPGPCEGPKRTWEVIDSEAKLERFLAELKEQKTFCMDLETTGLDAVRAEIVGWAFSWKPRTGYYIPVDGPDGEPFLEKTRVLDALRPVLESSALAVVNQNIKYDMLVLRRAGVRLGGLGLDPMIGDYLLDAGARSHGLNNLALKYLQHEMIPIGQLIGTGKQQKKMFEVEIARAAEYASEDADIAWQIAERIAADLRQAGLWDLYWELERPLISVLAEMEFAGIRVDVDELRRQSEELGGRLKQIMGEIYELAGREFNIDSPKQLSAILFDELKLPSFRKTKVGGNASTSQEVLVRLATLHPLPAKIIEHRHLSKLKSTYLDALPALVNPETGRIHASFNQVVAATGRLSSSDPNLQNIPIRTDEGSRIRKAFLAGEPGWVLVCADYSQIELRLLAHFSGDEALQAAFHRGADIHTAVASEIFGVDLRDVDSNMRRVAKAVNFGVIYGQSPFGLSQAIGISQDEAAAFIDSYFARYAGVDRYMQQLLAEVERTGYAKTILGRRRPITGIRSTTGRHRNLAERTAINTVIQGSAADLIKRAMINIHARLAGTRHPARMLLQIHDELVFEVPRDEAGSLIEIVRDEMESALTLRVALVVDVKVGENWLDAEPVPV